MNFINVSPLTARTFANQNELNPPASDIEGLYQFPRIFEGVQPSHSGTASTLLKLRIRNMQGCESYACSSVLKALNA